MKLHSTGKHIKLRPKKTGQHAPDNDKSTTAKRVVWFILINAVLWIWCSYILAFLGRENIAEQLSSVALTSLVTTILGYFGKSFAENLSKYNPFLNGTRRVAKDTPVQESTVQEPEYSEQEPVQSTDIEDGDNSPKG